MAPRSSYDDRSMNTLRFIRHARDLGFEIAQVRELLTLAAHPERHSVGTDAIARLHLDRVERRIAILQSLRGELRRMPRQCSGSRVATCPVTEVLTDHAHCSQSMVERLSKRAGVELITGDLRNDELWLEMPCVCFS